MSKQKISKIENYQSRFNKVYQSDHILIHHINLRTKLKKFYEKLTISQGLWNLTNNGIFIALDLILKPSNVPKSDTEKENRAWILFESSSKYCLFNTKWENLWNKIRNTEAINTGALPILSGIHIIDEF